LRFLGGRNAEQRRFHSLTLLPVAEEVLSSVEQIQSEWPSLIKLEDPKEGEYDLIILDNAASQTNDISTYLKPDAFVIGLGHSDISNEALAPAFFSASFKVWRKVDASSNSIPGPDLALVTAANPSDRTVSIASTISSAHPGSFTVSIDRLSQITPTPENIVILAALDKDILFNEETSDSEDFTTLQRILTTGKRNVVMALNGASMDSRKPEQALITGLARTARSENEELRLVLLDTSSTAQEADISSLITEILNPKIQEDELTERDGVVFIPRVQTDDILNSKLTHGSAQSASIQPLNQDRQLALKIGKVGAPDTLVFDDDLALQSSTLANDEVEIKVQASVISSRDSAAIIGAADESKLGDVCAGLVLRIGKDVDPTLVQPGDRVVAVRPGRGRAPDYCAQPCFMDLQIKR
jgi:NADPH:quinone reductase and related Zn-dependent oxidoreductases